jgi:hypothetical protein
MRKVRLMGGNIVRDEGGCSRTSGCWWQLCAAAAGIWTARSRVANYKGLHVAGRLLGY